tara:strand:+ start:36712 stop:36912 length:201 start_codon:yes stop_codon:yes gene_type:complete
MYNKDLLNKMLDKYDIEKVAEFCEMTAFMYDTKFLACSEQHLCSEFDFERDWWNSAYVELIKEIRL